MFNIICLKSKKKKYLKYSLLIKLALNRFILTQGNSRLVRVLRRFEDSLSLGNKLYSG